MQPAHPLTRVPPTPRPASSGTPRTPPARPRRCRRRVRSASATARRSRSAGLVRTSWRSASSPHHHGRGPAALGPSFSRCDSKALQALGLRLQVGCRVRAGERCTPQRARAARLDRGPWPTPGPSPLPRRRSPGWRAGERPPLMSEVRGRSLARWVTTVAVVPVSSRRSPGDVHVQPGSFQTPGRRRPASWSISRSAATTRPTSEASRARTAETRPGGSRRSRRTVLLDQQRAERSLTTTPDSVLPDGAPFPVLRLQTHSTSVEELVAACLGRSAASDRQVRDRVRPCPC